ncbi:very short patch repair endonuclease [Peredibacter starrii]|uniref:Very short patch repair endonuclease n=1 Tax=Peredibacter starrii TaxID=28202 RepID=A0AAX4HT90_9BACT|nr:very short patch repair endonuclease [Peredibacter starrii]WPU66621.1 very short patch repair endonuclease [Peredibacter starrii]
MEKNLKEHVPKIVSLERSRIMSKIKSNGNRSTELKIRMHLVRMGISGWEMQRKDLPGRPDFYFPKKKLVLFVDGCFWHGCPKCFKGTKTNKAFWNTKVESNRKRDRRNNKYYRGMGVKVIRIWEHEIDKKKESLYGIL